jgi:hypothetical protein
MDRVVHLHLLASHAVFDASYRTRIHAEGAIGQFCVMLDVSFSFFPIVELRSIDFGKAFMTTLVCVSQVRKGLSYLFCTHFDCLSNGFKPNPLFYDNEHEKSSTRRSSAMKAIS